MLTPPLHLYHYTSIDTLALILKTRKIKLNRLDQLNDPTEEVSRDGRYGKYLFVTCWTSESSEILPFWYMYGHNRRGVRIQLPNNFIKTYTVRERSQEIDGPIIYGKSFESILPEERLFSSEDHWVANYGATINKFYPITYTDDQQFLTPKVRHETPDNGLTVALDTLGKHKPEIWAFEKEWRFRLIIHPYGITQMDPMNTLPLRRAFEDEKELSLKEYFLEISEEAYSQMEVLLGPLSTDSDEIIVNALIQKYNPAAKSCPSNLRGKIR